MNSGKFRFRDHDSVGNLSAESDANFLSECFVDESGRLEILRDPADERGILVGRTGAGKTALLKILAEEEERVIELDVQSLSVSYISNSTVLSFFESLQVNLDLFYRFLWRHIFFVALIKRHLGMESEDQKLSFFDNVRNRLTSGHSYIEALDYLGTWGTSFWTTTEAVIVEDLRKMETDLNAKAGMSLNGVITLGAEGTKRLTEEQHAQLKQRGQEVINNIQIHKLATLIEALNKKFLTDSQKRYYVLVDCLDEYWVDEQRRIPLIRALIETMRYMNSKIHQAKIIIALRADLLQQVLAAANEPGFQPEKYQSLTLPVTWSRLSLIKVLDRRINKLLEHWYTGKPVTHKLLLPEVIGREKQPAIDYFLDRTLMRPRDVIAFFNCCMESAANATAIAPRHLYQAETRYSVDRMNSLAAEWSGLYPSLKLLSAVLKKRPFCFKLGELEEEVLQEMCLEVLCQDPPKPGKDSTRLQLYFDGQISCTALRIWLARVLYQVGILGLKTATYREVAWVMQHQTDALLDTITEETTVHIQKMFWRALGISGPEAQDTQESLQTVKSGRAW